MMKRFSFNNRNTLFRMICLGTLVACQGGNTPDEAEQINSDYYNEKHRPQFHFSPRANWMNDPNGMVFYGGEYHLCYQYYPDSTVWGPMHWGHAVSADLVHWEHLPVALHPDTLGYIFSGSAVVDRQNTSGLGTKNNPPLVAIYTHHDPKGEEAGRNDFQSQGIAFSLDRGRTWIKYHDNPVLKNPGIRDFRDPKVFRHEGTGRWVMVLAAFDHIRFYSSSDLLSWQMESVFGKGKGSHGGVWECPDLFELAVEGTGESKWILIVSIGGGGPNGGSATQYFIGDFNGYRFNSIDEKTRWVDYGKDNYAGVTWSGIPDEDGRRIFIGWMSNWQYAQKVPTHPWRSAMTIPRELKLAAGPDGYILVSSPVTELENITINKIPIQPQAIVEEADLTNKLSFPVNTSETHCVFRVPGFYATSDTVRFGLSLRNAAGEELNIGYNLSQRYFYVDRNQLLADFSADGFTGEHRAPWERDELKIEMRVLIDRSSVECFFMDGRLVMTELYFSRDELDQLWLFSENIDIDLIEAEIKGLEGIWTVN